MKNKAIKYTHRLNVLMILTHFACCGDTKHGKNNWCALHGRPHSQCNKNEEKKKTKNELYVQVFNAFEFVAGSMQTLFPFYPQFNTT